MSKQNYTYAEHRFRFAAWAAGNAVKRGPAGFSFKVKDAHCILDKIGFRELAEKNVAWLPKPVDFDMEHRNWYENIYQNKKEFTHGRAAKLINVFIKILMPIDIEKLPKIDKEKWYAVHPPIDRNLLQNMKKNGIGCPSFWSSLPGSSIPAWTKFDPKHYQDVICLIRKNLKSRLVLNNNNPVPLWKIEKYWDGHQ